MKNTQEIGYIYRVRTPFGAINEYYGEGDRIRFPKELVDGLWFWILVDKIFKCGHGNQDWNILIERRRVDKKIWQQVYFWPARFIK